VGIEPFEEAAGATPDGSRHFLTPGLYEFGELLNAAKITKAD